MVFYQSIYQQIDNSYSYYYSIMIIWYIQGVHLVVIHSAAAVGYFDVLLEGISMVAHRESGNTNNNIQHLYGAL